MSAFIYRDRLALQRGGELGDELLLRAGEWFALCIVAGGGGDAVDAIIQELHAVDGFLHGGVVLGGSVAQGEHLTHRIAHGVILIEGGSGGGAGGEVGAWRRGRMLRLIA